MIDVEKEIARLTEALKISEEANDYLAAEAEVNHTAVNLAERKARRAETRLAMAEKLAGSVESFLERTAGCGKVDENLVDSIHNYRYYAPRPPPPVPSAAVPVAAPTSVVRFTVDNLVPYLQFAGSFFP